MLVAVFISLILLEMIELMDHWLELTNADVERKFTNKLTKIANFLVFHMKTTVVVLSSWQRHVGRRKLRSLYFRPTRLVFDSFQNKPFNHSHHQKFSKCHISK